jgi:ATP synthase F1 gamma subunit
LAQFETHEIDAVVCVHNAYTGMGSYHPTVTPLLPPPLPEKRPLADTWPPPIIETDPVTLYTQIVQQWTATRFYTLLLQSAMAEHSVRYQLMESAGQNVERLIDELAVVVQAARQQTITREMQALAVGAGLVSDE